MKRYALIIGINYVRDLAPLPGDQSHPPIRTLNCAERDAQSMHDFLIDECEFEPGNIRFLLGKRATFGAAIGALTELAGKLLNEDLLVVYFAGHGTIHRADKNARFDHYLLCYDTILPTKGGYSDIAPALKESAILAIQARGCNLVLITDACRDEYDEEASAGRAAGSSARRFDPSKHYRNLAESPEYKRSGLVIIHACGSGGKARELARHGLFTLALLDVMRAWRGAGNRLDMSGAFGDKLKEHQRYLAKKHRCGSEEQEPGYNNDSSLREPIDASPGPAVATLRGETEPPPPPPVLKQLVQFVAVAVLSIWVGYMTARVQPVARGEEIAAKAADKKTEPSRDVDDGHQRTGPATDDIQRPQPPLTQGSKQQDTLRSGQGSANSPASDPNLKSIVTRAEQSYRQGLLLVKVNATKVELATARRLFSQSSDDGHAEAKVALAQMCEKGLGGDEEPSRAMELYEEAAKLGNQAAKDALARSTTKK